MRTSFTTSTTEGRIGRHRLLPVLVLAAILITSATDLRAASIGVNFLHSGSGQALPSGTSAGVAPQTNWQNVATTSISGLTLTDNTGAATSAALTVTGSGLGLSWYNSSAAIGDEWLMDTYMNASGTMTFSITSIPYAAYDLIIYNLPLFMGAKYTYIVDSTSYFGYSPSTSQSSPGYIDNNSGTPFNYVEAVSTNTSLPTPNSTYTQFEGLTGSSLTFTVTGANGIAFSNGFQIVEIVPEPSRAVLLLGGILAVSFRRRR